MCAISTNSKHTIYRNLYANTGPDILLCLLYIIVQLAIIEVCISPKLQCLHDVYRISYLTYTKALLIKLTWLTSNIHTLFHVFFRYYLMILHINDTCPFVFVLLDVS